MLLEGLEKLGMPKIEKCVATARTASDTPFLLNHTGYPHKSQQKECSHIKESDYEFNKPRGSFSESRWVTKTVKVATEGQVEKECTDIDDILTFLGPVKCKKTGNMVVNKREKLHGRAGL